MLSKSDARVGHIAHVPQRLADRHRQHGQSPSYPSMSTAKAVDCGTVIISWGGEIDEDRCEPGPAATGPITIT
jgi:hypothetical protein